MESISVIIPTLEEESSLPLCLDCLNRQNRLPHEILVVDAGSRDRTLDRAREGGARIIANIAPDRARQLNAGAGASRGTLLLFLHADTLLQPRALEKMGQAMNDPALVGGGFKRRFHPPHPGLALSSRLADLRGITRGYFHGDQAIFCRRRAFESAGGFPEIFPFEDFEFCRSLKRIGKLTTLGPPVLSSSRRFQEEGTLSTIWNDFWLTRSYFSKNRAE